MNKDEHIDDDKLQLFCKRKRSLLLCLVILTLTNNFIMSLQDGVELSKMCWLLLNLCILFFVMNRTWKAGLLLWIFEFPSAMLYIVSCRRLLQYLSLDYPLLSIRIFLALFGSVVSIFTVVWLTLIPKKRRYSEKC